MIPTASCQACDWTGPADLCGPLKRAWERVQPGDVMPAGECPLCNASAMLNEPPRPAANGPRFRPVCNRCGGTDVLADAYASWDVDAQDWALHSTYEKNAWCSRCEGECSFDLEPVPAEAA
ncbi:MAG: hypothetical protein OYH76_01145 [Defluviicoccus sp.]|nr:hypothetical protein [Defluviicoccus sp.]MDE0274469.1 hypothetical protein [Defluviicoccus sp.]